MGNGGGVQKGLGVRVGCVCGGEGMGGNNKSC